MKKIYDSPLVDTVADLSGCILFIIDDDEVNREVLSGLFEAEGFTVHQAGQAVGLLDTVRKLSPDLILLDVMMPEVDGFMFCEQLKADPVTQPIPVIMLTALSGIEDEARGLACGAVDFVSKPFHAKVVKARVFTQLHLKKHRDLLKRQSEQLARINDQLIKRIYDYQEASDRLRMAKKEIEQANLVKEGLIKDLFEAMCEMLSSRDHYTFEHGMRVAALSRRIGEKMGLPAKKLESLELGCLVHDISKVAIPDDVLLKPGVFDSYDRHIMRMHPEMGARIFARRHSDPDIIDIILKHHERLDGSGYPAGLKGDQLSLSVRIAMVADSYEALIARRPYKRPMEREHALAVLREDVAAGRFDAEVVRVLEEVTTGWNPLEVGRRQAESHARELDAFRRKIYFKEPLSDFYNYRYLFFLADSQLLRQPESGYRLIKVQFDNLDEVNEREGYLKTDQIIDEIGTNFQTMIDELAACPEAGSNILFRKGSTYIVFTNCQTDAVRAIEAHFAECLEQLHLDWGLDSRTIVRRFPPAEPLDKALYELLES